MLRIKFAVNKSFFLYFCIFVHCSLRSPHHEKLKIKLSLLGCNHNTIYWLVANTTPFIGGCNHKSICSLIGCNHNSIHWLVAITTPFIGWFVRNVLMTFMNNKTNSNRFEFVLFRLSDTHANK